MIADTFANGLRPLQIAGALTIYEKRRALLADQPGAGKTAQALVAAELAGMFTGRRNVLILCNVTGCQLTWGPELINRVATQHDVVIADLTDTEGKKTMPSVAARNDRLGLAMIEADDEQLPLIVLANYDLIRWQHGKRPKLTNVFDIEFDMVIIDEAHLVLPTKEDAGNKVTQFWYGLMNLSLTHDAIRLPMTGTPDRGKLENRYGIWKFMHPLSHKSFWSWARSNFILMPDGWGGMEIGKMRQPKVWESYDRQHMIRRTKSEMLQGLPEKQWAGDGAIDLPMTFLQAEAYSAYISELEKQESEFLSKGEEGKAHALKMQFSLRARQMATCTWDFVETDGSTHGVPRVAGVESSNKLAWILDWMRSRGYVRTDFDPSLGKVVIVSYFTEVLRWLQKELAAADIASAVMEGDTPGVTKKQIEADFQRGALRVVLLSGYLGVSINLDAADDMIFVDLPYDPDLVEQAEDRIHRASRNHQCTYWRLVSIGSADQVTIETIDHRYRATRATYDGARGVAFARRFMSKHEKVSA